MLKKDCVQHFYFSDAAVRGAFVNLSNSYIEALNGRDYPPPVTALLGEALSASVLMSTHFKKKASLALQIRGSGAINLLLAETHFSQKSDPLDNNTPQSKQTIRGLARFDNDKLNKIEKHKKDNLVELFDNAQLAITIEPEKGSRYQGIVALDKSSIANCLQQYFSDSEQLPTLLKLFTRENETSGLLLQAIPSTGGFNKETKECPQKLWEELSILAGSIKEAELFELKSEEVLRRLFVEYDLMLNPHEDVNFHCTCSQERTGKALLTVDPIELDKILEEDDEIVMDCEFCSSRYRFDQKAINSLIQQQQGTRH